MPEMPRHYSNTQAGYEPSFLCITIRKGVYCNRLIFDPTTLSAEYNLSELLNPNQSFQELFPIMYISNKDIFLHFSLFLVCSLKCLSSTRLLYTVNMWDLCVFILSALLMYIITAQLPETTRQPLTVQIKRNHCRKEKLRKAFLLSNM